MIQSSSAAKRRSVDPSNFVLPASHFQRAQTLHFLICAASTTLLSVALPLFLPWLWAPTGVIVFIGMYTFVMALGISLGFHRLFSHGAFKTRPWFRYLCGVAGSMAAQGPLYYWVALHRRHHAFSDIPGDPHSPSPSAGRHRGRLRAFLHGHMLWVLKHDVPKPARYTPDLLADPVARSVSRFYWYWVALGFALPGIAVAALDHSFNGLLIGVYWGGLVRTAVVQQVIWSVNSVAHTIGSRPYRTEDNSRNVWPLAILSFGDAFHNNHHHAPTAANFSHHWWQLDIGWLIIRVLEKTGCIKGIRRYNAEVTSLGDISN